MWIQGSRSGPPASSSSTLCLPSAVSRLASTQPAEPAPTMTKSTSPERSTALLPCCPARPRDDGVSEPPRRQDAKRKSTTWPARHPCGVEDRSAWWPGDQGDEGDREQLARGGGAVFVLGDDREHLAGARLPE